MQAAQVLVRTTRERERGGGLSMAGFGASVSQGVASTVPSLLESLDHGVTPNIGLPSATITLNGTSPGSIRPLVFEELRPTLQRYYDEQLGSLDEDHHVKRLVAWGTSDSEAAQTQPTLSLLWDVKQSTVSQTLGYLTKHGYVMALPREVRAAQQYLLTGRSRLVL